LRKRKFKTVLVRLEFVPRSNGFRAFRHANANMLDRLGKLLGSYLKMARRDPTRSENHGKGDPELVGLI